MIHLNVYTSLIASIIIQLITGIIEIFTLFIPVKSSFLFLKQLVLLEFFVQIIELSFYIYWLYNFNHIFNITPKRYIDWAITTPTMLVNLIFYLIFLQYKQNNISDQLHFFTLFRQQFYTIITILLLNSIMLLFGYLAEIHVLPLFLAVFLGFIPFLIYYYIIYTKYAILTNDGYQIFFYFFIFWSLYGIAALLPYKIKNISYNILDLFSKNFFSIFLAYIIFTNKY